jgi:hypothetical protein
LSPPEIDSRFSFTYDATGYFVWPGYLDDVRAETVAASLDEMGWDESGFERTRRIDSIVEKSPLVRELALGIFRSNWLAAAMTYPHRLIESYALDRALGGSLPIHGGATERLTRAGHAAAEDISCMYLVRSGQMYSLRTKALLYLDPVLDEQDGPLTYVEGSHKANFPFVQSFATGPASVAGAEHLLRQIPVEPGTLVFLNEALVHGALEKRSTCRRRMMVFTFAPSFATDWSELARGDSELGRLGYVVPDTEDSH